MNINAVKEKLFISDDCFTYQITVAYVVLITIIYKSSISTICWGNRTTRQFTLPLLYPNDSYIYSRQL